jgi:hypothetical protein
MIWCEILGLKEPIMKKSWQRFFVGSPLTTGAPTRQRGCEAMPEPSIVPSCHHRNIEPTKLLLT